MTADEFCRRMHNDIRTVFQGPEEIRRPEGVVDHHRNLVPMGDFGDCIHVSDIGIRVSQGFQEHGFGIGADRRFHFLQVMGVHECRLNAIVLQGVLQQVVASAVNGVLGHDVVPCVSQCKDGICDGCRLGCRGQAGHSAFQCGDPLLQDILGGIGQPSVDVAGICEPEPVRRMLRVVKHIGCGLVDGD